MNFWDTERGHHLADTLIRFLPKLAEEKKQYTRLVLRRQLKKIVDEELENGARVISITEMPEDTLLVIFEK